MSVQEIKLPDGAGTTVEWFGDGRAPKGMVAFLPALGVSRDYYTGLNRAWAQRGYRVAAVEMRGMKHSSVRDVKRENFGYKEILTLDLPELIGALQEEAGGMPFILAGHSLGGQFALLHAARHSEGIDGVALIAGGSNFYGSMPTGMIRLKRRFGIRLVRLVNGMLGYFPGDKLGFGGRQPRNMMADWTYEGLTGEYKVTGDLTDYNAALAGLDLPVIIVSLSGDRLVPRSCADFLSAKLRKARITQVELLARDYGMQAFHHFRWVRNPAPVLDQIERWTAKMRPVKAVTAAGNSSSF